MQRHCQKRQWLSFLCSGNRTRSSQALNHALPCLPTQPKALTCSWLWHNAVMQRHCQKRQWLYHSSAHGIAPGTDKPGTCWGSLCTITVKENKTIDIDELRRDYIRGRQPTARQPLRGKIIWINIICIFSRVVDAACDKNYNSFLASGGKKVAHHWTTSLHYFVQFCIGHNFLPMDESY